MLLYFTSWEVLGPKWGASHLLRKCSASVQCHVVLVRVVIALMKRDNQEQPEEESVSFTDSHKQFVMKNSEYRNSSRAGTSSHELMP